MLPDGKTHNQTNHTVIDRIRHSSVLDVQSFRAADCDNCDIGDYSMVDKFMKTLTVNKQSSHRCNLKKLKVDGK
jgi:hypothetical protein